MLEKMYITIEGKRKLEEELSKIRFKDRPKIVRELDEARQQGDLSENAEYHAAKERLAHIDAKINDLETKLVRAEVVDISRIDASKVVFGTKVKLVDLNTGQELTYRIVGDFEADVAKNEISINSPIAKALIGKEAGDSVSVRTPGGQREFEIIEISK